MASRAHAVRHYSFGSANPRTRRDVWYRREDPVVLPRSRGWSVDYRLIAAALAASALVTGATYAAFYTAPPSLSETPAAPLARDWQPDAELGRSAALEVLSGPTHAARNVGALGARSDEVFFDGASSAEPSALDAQPSSTPEAPSAPPPHDAIPYPNPSTTPPDAIAPPETPNDAPTPLLNPENPYR